MVADRPPLPQTQRIARRLARPLPPDDWQPPVLTDLLARIDARLRERDR